MSTLLVLVVLCGFFTCGFPIMCYECNSAKNTLCTSNALPDSLKRNCSDHDRGGITHTLCRKIVQHVDYDVGGYRPQSRVIRSCGWDETKYKGSCYHRSGFGGHHEVCSCTRDLCNGSDKIDISSKLLGPIVVFLSATIIELY